MTNFREHERVSVDFTDSIARTKQSFKEECDANAIMRKWHKTGQVDHINKNPPRYGDFENAGDYLSAKLAVQAMHDEFGQMSSAVRDRMNNDPATFMEFMNDPDNLDEAVELGLIKKPETTAPPTPPAPPVADPPPEPTPEPSPVSGGD